MFFVYILRSEKDNNFYVGFTTDLKKRLLKHNGGRVFSTKNRRPLTWVYAEICLNKQDALQRERYLKSGRGKRFIKQRLLCYLKDV